MNEYEKLTGEIEVSVIIPVFNVGKYLENCISSVMNQSKKDIEIICIDDCSTDNSAEILEKMSLKDKRIRIIKNSENRGQLYARKRGVMAAEGKYIMFLDGDDFYSINTCEIAYLAIAESSTDILQFGINIINKGSAPQFEVESFSNFVIPYEGRIAGVDVLKACFDKEKYNYHLFNKIYKADLCKKAFSYLDDNYYCMAEDMLAYFVLAYFAESYAGIQDKLYNYNFAIGISKPGKLDLEGLDKRCCGAESINAVKRFLESQGIFEDYKDTYIKMERRILSDNFDAWYYRLPFEEREKGYTIFEKHWGKDKVMLSFLYDIENKQYDINQKAFVIEQNRAELEKRDAQIKQLQQMINQKICDLNEREKEIQRNSELLSRERENCANIQAEHDKLALEYGRISNSLSYRLGCGFTWLPRKIAWFVRKAKRKS